MPAFPLMPQESGPAEGEQAKTREAAHHQPEGEGASGRTVATVTGAGQGVGEEDSVSFWGEHGEERLQGGRREKTL